MSKSQKFTTFTFKMLVLSLCSWLQDAIALQTLVQNAFKKIESIIFLFMSEQTIGRYFFIGFTIGDNFHLGWPMVFHKSDTLSYCVGKTV